MQDFKNINERSVIESVQNFEAKLQDQKEKLLQKGYDEFEERARQKMNAEAAQMTKSWIAPLERAGVPEDDE